MAIRLTSTTQTSAGSTTALYQRIKTITLTKTGVDSVVEMEIFKDENSLTEQVSFFQNNGLKHYHTLDLSATIDSAHAKKIAYDEIGALQKAGGLLPESDETGSWVAY